ncbi:MAG: peroxiredoxin [Gammaproteobacteria bacterium]|nr:peroxiredoxin [Gammaproteobacteria bacterium]MDH5303481.1 peroxiredoxin [Gammaproteobacteria bacterium]MDH5321510.1 peroxiredoxin [Gammaproteobacteria bacterium]
MKYTIPLQIVLIAALFSASCVATAEQPAIGTPAPEFELPDQAGQLHSLEDYRDRWVVLYFYPKDETPGCTTEACAFRDNIFAYREMNAQILGVSFDDVESHKQFAEHHGLPFPLLADSDGKAADAYGVRTRMFGMTVAKRETFLIDPAGNIAKHYGSVKPDAHSAEVLADLKALSAKAPVD